MHLALLPAGRRRLGHAVAAALAATLLLAGYLAVTSTFPAVAAPSLLSQGKPTTASSVENAGFPAANATDGNNGTRWSSAFSNPQWIQVDLGETAALTQVILRWEGAYATAFQIQVSGAATGPWTNVFSTTTGTGGVQTLNVSGSGRYVRMNGTARATGYGYSLWEFQVYGSTGSTQPTCAGNAALNRPATASSIEIGTPGEAFDGNPGTRWGSLFADPQWIRVDLGSAMTICQVVLQWEGAYGRAYQIQTSADGNT